MFHTTSLYLCIFSPELRHARWRRRKEEVIWILIWLFASFDINSQILQPQLKARNLLNFSPLGNQIIYFHFPKRDSLLLLSLNTFSSDPSYDFMTRTWTKLKIKYIYKYGLGWLDRLPIFGASFKILSPSTPGSLAVCRIQEVDFFKFDPLNMMPSSRDWHSKRQERVRH